MRKQIGEAQISQLYAPLADFLKTLFDVELEISTLTKIALISAEIQSELAELSRDVCDVEGCELEPVSGGNAWRETGYWSVCSNHSRLSRQGEGQPQMKSEAIEREQSRDSNGYLS
ncbi:MAG TPA: hypothetical protein PKY82_34210 [Pyrinomonadaceae bacterium]|nr:hypothetical protein [Pyrinomonadaceae bacterium]